jgi:hypothetical protein
MTGTNDKITTREQTSCADLFMSGSPEREINRRLYSEEMRWFGKRNVKLFKDRGVVQFAVLYGVILSVAVFQAK